MKLSLRSKTLFLMLLAGSFARAQNVSQPEAGEWMKGRLINRRTGEVIQAKCYEKASDGKCAKFQYFYAENVNETPRALGLVYEHAKITELLNQRTRPGEDDGDVFHSSKLFYISNAVGFTLLSSTEMAGSNMIFITVDGLYRHGKYTSNGVYALQVIGATPLAAVVGATGVFGTAFTGALDVALWPARLTIGLVNGFEGRFKVKGRERRVLKRTLRESDVLMDAEGDLYLGTAKWKTILDLVSENEL